MKYYVSIILLLLCVSCSNSNSSTDESNTDNSSTQSAPSDTVAIPDVGGCYLHVTGKDTLTVALKQEGIELTGSAVYDHFEKDGSSGTLEGTIRANGVIHAWYSFQAEGMNSVRELMYKKEGDRLILAFADEYQRHDTSFIRNVDSVQFAGSALVFEPVPCNQ